MSMDLRGNVICPGEAKCPHSECRASGCMQERMSTPLRENVTPHEAAMNALVRPESRDAFRHGVEALVSQNADMRENVTEEVEWLLRECRANIAEMADDLKGFYEPEKGWPPHIEKADEMLAEIDDLLGESRFHGDS